MRCPHCGKPIDPREPVQPGTRQERDGPPPRDPSHRWASVVAAVALAILTGWMLGGGHRTLVTRVCAPDTTPSPGHEYCRSDYDRIRDDMTLAEVELIMGGPGKMVSSSHTPAVPGVRAPIDTAMYMWVNSDGGNCHVLFQNGRVVSGAQVGLP